MNTEQKKILSDFFRILVEQSRKGFSEDGLATLQQIDQLFDQAMDAKMHEDVSWVDDVESCFAAISVVDSEHVGSFLARFEEWYDEQSLESDPSDVVTMRWRYGGWCCHCKEGFPKKTVFKVGPILASIGCKAHCIGRVEMLHKPRC